MIIECTSCGAQYDVGDDVVSGNGRYVQCSVCFNAWTAMPTGSSAAVASTSMDAAYPQPPQPPQSQPPQSQSLQPPQLQPPQPQPLPSQGQAQTSNVPEMGSVGSIQQSEASLDDLSLDEIEPLNEEALESLELPDTDILQDSDLDAGFDTVVQDEEAKSEGVASNTVLETFDTSDLEPDLDSASSTEAVAENAFESESSFSLDEPFDMGMTTEGVESLSTLDQSKSLLQDSTNESSGSLDLSELASFLGEEALTEQDVALPIDSTFGEEDEPDDFDMLPSSFGAKTTDEVVEEAPLAPDEEHALEEVESSETNEVEHANPLGSFVAFGSVRGWLVLVCLVLVIGGGGYMWRNEVVNAFPAVKLLYERLGLATKFKQGNLEIVEGQVKFYRTSTLAGDALTVAGVVRNRSKSTPERTRVIRIDLLDEYGRVLQSELVSPVQSLLLPAEESLFQARISNPAENTVDAALTLTLDYTSLDK